MSNRLNSHARRDLIVEAAVPLFARKGFAGTTTREIAEAAGVSEGLLFKYFANKTALYDAIVHQFEGQQPTFEEVRGLVPSSYSLVKFVRVTTERFITLAGGSETMRARYRMFLRSLCEDGAFARVGCACYSSNASMRRGVPGIWLMTRRMRGRLSGCCRNISSCSRHGDWRQSGPRRPSRLKKAYTLFYAVSA
jgi:AcrR family transcriptional regulator